MITIEEGLVILVTGSATMHALIGDRFHHGEIPQGSTLPVLIYHRIDSPRVLTHDTAGANGTVHARFQFDVWSDTALSCKAVTDALRGLLNGYKGTIGVNPNTVKVQGALIQDEHSEHETETNLQRSISDYSIWYEE